MPNIIVYTSTTCKFCDKLKDFLKQNNISFEERNAKLNPMYAQELQMKSGGFAVPVVDIDGTIIIGFNPKRLKEMLKLS